MSQAAPPGWHPDPSDPTALRWWDGTRWTDQTAPAAGYAPPLGPPPSGPPPNGSSPAGAQPRPADPYQPYPGTLPSEQTFSMRSGSYDHGRFGTGRGPNSFSLSAIAFAAVYMALAFSTGFVILGIVPVFSAIRAFQRREKLAPLAFLAAAATVSTAVYFLVHGHR